MHHIRKCLAKCQRDETFVSYMQQILFTPVSEIHQSVQCDTNFKADCWKLLTGYIVCVCFSFLPAQRFCSRAVKIDKLLEGKMHKGASTRVLQCCLIRSNRLAAGDHAAFSNIGLRCTPCCTSNRPASKARMCLNIF